MRLVEKIRLWPRHKKIQYIWLIVSLCAILLISFWTILGMFFSKQDAAAKTNQLKDQFKSSQEYWQNNLKKSHEQSQNTGGQRQ